MLKNCDQTVYLSQRHADEAAAEGQSAEECKNCGYWHLKKDSAKKAEA